MKNIRSKFNHSFIAKTVGLSLLSGSMLLGSVAPASAAGIPDTSSTVDPGPVGDFNWNGANWEKRYWSGAPHYNKNFSADNVSNPDANGYVKLTLTNPTGNSPVAAEFNTTKHGWGYGTYSTVIEKDLKAMQPEVVWGCMFTYDPAVSPGFNEIDVCEASAWGGGSTYNQTWPVEQAHGYWFDAISGVGKGNQVDVFPVPTNPIQTHRMTWEKDKLTYETFAGEGFTGTLLKKTVFEGENVPEPANETIHFNLWVIGENSTSYANVKPETVTVRDFSFIPLSETPTPEPVATPTIKKAGSVLAIDGNGVLWNYGNPVGSRVKVGNGWQIMKDVHVTDWNADGYQDILAQAKDGKLYYYQGKKYGGFTRYQIGSGWGAFEVNIAKWKKTDAYPSIIARNVSNGDLFVYGNASGQSLSPRIKVGAGWQNFNNLNVLDYDKDGNIDILSKDNTGKIKLYRTTGDGKFINETRRIIGSGWQNFTSVTTMNNYKGNPNAGLVAKTSDGKLYYYETGTNTWKPRLLIGGGGWNPYTVASH